MKKISGKVVSAKTPKTVIVKVDTLRRHAFYQKRVKWSKKYSVHAEEKISEGQWVKIAETKPISKTKRWKVIEVIKK